jgi:protein-disulfide isomerase
MFAGIPEHNGVLGDPKAPVTVTEYLDLQCPVCDEASKNMLPTLVRDYVRTGKVKLQARTLHFIGPDSVKAARVAAGAQQQGKLWPFLETFYANQGEENSGYVTDSFLRQVAQASGVNATAALGQANSAFASARLNQANTDASKLGIDSTPTLTVAKGNGPAKLLNANVVDAGSVSAALNQELGA